MKILYDYARHCKEGRRAAVTLKPVCEANATDACDLPLIPSDCLG